MPPSSEYHIPPASGTESASEKPSSTKFGSGMITAKKMFILGMLLPLFSPPIVGIVYSLAFIFNRETRREGSIILIWAVIIGIVAYGINQWMVLNGYSQPFSN